MSTNERELAHVDLSKPRYDQRGYVGRFKHFFVTVSPLNMFASNRKLAEAAQLVKSHKDGNTPPGTTEEQLWAAKTLYDSAYHPDTHRVMPLFGRMSFQVPGNMVITGLMTTYYKHPWAVTLWQSSNQLYNAAVNFTNRSGSKDISERQIVVCGLTATVVATATALKLNQLINKNLHQIPPLVWRFVPFVAVMAANMINIPLMRYEELKSGVSLMDKNGNKLGEERSKKAARRGVTQVVISRIMIALPVIVVPPLLTESLKKVIPSVKPFGAALTVIFTGLCLWPVVPTGLAVFPQISCLSVAKLEPNVRDSVLRVSPNTEQVYYNKGL